MQKKSMFFLAVAAMSGVNALAGGLLTNTNQNAAYVRQMSQNGIIGLEGMYANPAGTAFLSNGWHLTLNSQSAWQQRNISTTFPLFAFNAKDPGAATHEFRGKASAPVIPSFSLSYNQDKWSVNAHFALIGGGGKCEFNKGLGSFEALVGGNIATGIIESIATGYAQQAIPAYMAQGMTMEQAQAAVAGPAKEYAVGAFGANPTNYLKGYSMNSTMEGRSYYFGLQLGATYKFTDNLAGFLGVRGVYGTCSYVGNVMDINYTTAAGSASAPGIALDCDQAAFGVTPIIGIDWKINEHWNVAAKYEAPTMMNLKNTSELSDAAKVMSQDPTSPLAQFRDGEKVREDIPGILAVGAQYSPIETIRLSAGGNYYFDKQAKKFGDKQNLLDHNTWEVNAGVEYDCCKWLTVSASWQSTQYGLSDASMNDLSFNNSNNMVGAGVRIHATDRLDIDLGYMHTFYQDRTVVSKTAVGDKTDVYSRKNDVIGVGVTLNL